VRWWHRLADRVLVALLGERFKEWVELRFWRGRQAIEKELANDQYLRLFTRQFSLSEGDYAGKAILDVGCGPRGSLEWAVMARRRVGLDSLAREYLELGTRRHAMAYVDGRAESMPFRSGSFDIVASFNSLDHVRDVDRVLGEIGRVTRPGGLFLLIVEVNHEPTPTEPHRLSPAVLDRLVPQFSVASVAAYKEGPEHIYRAWERGTAEAVPRPRDLAEPGWLVARLVRA
jgi:ubiquinone/menaquinone biosynthesis C-methylase UbiE